MPAPDSLLAATALAAALGSGVVAGIFFAFSTFVMRALARLPASEGLAAMQSINIAVLNPWFLGVFLGTSLVSLAAVGAALFDLQATRAPYLLLGAALYLLGCVLVTGAANVPLNESLATLEPTSPAAETAWASYLTTWTTWNHIRCAASLAAAMAFLRSCFE